MFDIASQLKNCRQRKGYSQIDVFNHTGIHNKTLSGYERGISTPDVDTLRTLLIFYETPADEFLMMPKFNRKKENQAVGLQDNLHQIRLLNTYLLLDSRDQDTILKMAETLLSSHNTQQNDTINPKKGA